MPHKFYDKPLVRWIDNRLPLFTFIRQALHEYPTPKNLNFLWNTGSLAGITLIIMIISGITLAMHYCPTPDQAFQSVERIMRDVNYGWLIRYIHMNGASFFFILIYLHIFRGLYYGSYKSPRELLWMLGVVIFLLMMATAFMGYVLPWGQMSFWGAKVITNLFSAIPLIGDSIVHWILGGPTVGAPTLQRFFALHYLFPFGIVAIVCLHLVALHQFGSNNPTGIECKDPSEFVPFHPYYTIKDLVGLGIYLVCFAIVVFFIPNLFSEPDNFIVANPLITPLHIVPEWYFLPFYAILRSIPHKLGGVIGMFGAVVTLFIVPWLDRSPVRSATFRPLYRPFFWIFVLNCLVLGWVGARPPEGIPLLLGRIATFYYFCHFFLILPLLSVMEKPHPLPPSVSAYAKKKGAFWIALFVLLGGIPVYGQAVSATPRIPPSHHWSFETPLGTFDRAELQRGFQVYKEVCSSCHGIKQIRFRDLQDIGLSKSLIKTLAATYTISDQEEEGKQITRPGKPNDAFPDPFLTEEEARTANGGTYPPDLSLITKARPFGPRYLYALITHNEPCPKDVALFEGKFYNPYFQGGQISMPPPLIANMVVYQDGTPATVSQMAHDVVAFLSWVAEPTLENRHEMGVKVLVFLIVLTGLLYSIYRILWRRIR